MSCHSRERGGGAQPGRPPAAEATLRSASRPAASSDRQPGLRWIVTGAVKVHGHGVRAGCPASRSRGTWPLVLTEAPLARADSGGQLRRELVDQRGAAVAERDPGAPPPRTPMTSRLAHDLADDPPAPPAQRLQRAELAHPAG